MAIKSRKKKLKKRAVADESGRTRAANERVQHLLGEVAVHLCILCIDNELVGTKAARRHFKGAFARATLAQVIAFGILFKKK